MSRHFDRDYRERCSLRDGSVVELRLVRPEDRALLARGFERLSPESRYRRFLTAKPRLTDLELTYLTAVDQERHVAIGAVRVDEIGRELPCGVGRFIRLPEDPEVAEAAVTVLDDVQGRGLGSLLLLRLIAAAQERGVRRFRCVVLAENDEMRTLMHELLPSSVDHAEGTEVVIEAPLPEVEHDQPESQRPRSHWTYALLQSAASGTLEVLGALRRRNVAGAYDSLLDMVGDARRATGLGDGPPEDDPAQ